jgi:hypothetical protein
VLDQFGLMERTVGIGADLQHSPEAGKRYRNVSASFPAAAGARSPDIFETVVRDTNSSWVLASFAPSLDLYTLARSAGKRVLASGPEIRNNVRSAVTAMQTGADLVLSDHPLDVAARWRTEARR